MYCSVLNVIRFVWKGTERRASFITSEHLYLALFSLEKRVSLPLPNLFGET